jgi:acyl-CoA oxidase
MMNPKKGHINSDPKVVKEFAAVSAGMKSYCTKIAIEGIEDLRKSCGGAGYLLNSGIGQLM